MCVCHALYVCLCTTNPLVRDRERDFLWYPFRNIFEFEFLVESFKYFVSVGFRMLLLPILSTGVWFNVVVLQRHFRSRDLYSLHCMQKRSGCLLVKVLELLVLSETVFQPCCFIDRVLKLTALYVPPGVPLFSHY